MTDAPQNAADAFPRPPVPAGTPAQRPDEIFDVVDGNDRVVGQATRAQVHRERLFHRAVHIVVFDGRGNAYLQKRSLAKDTCPGLFSTSCAGHVDAGEDYESAARRELEEELGIRVGEGGAGTPEFLFAMSPRRETGWEFLRVYRLDFTGTPTPNAAEIDALRALPPRKIDEEIRERPEIFSESFLCVWKKLRAETDRGGRVPAGN